jgi:glycosyltransferase involved in cell wall biosynthesis
MKKYPVCAVSVILPFYNAANSIELSLNSVFEQSLLPLEIIIVDDASKKEEHLELIKIIDKYNNKIVTINHYSIDVNKGASFCRNIAINHAKGKYLAFLDADDVWHERKLELQYAFMEKSNCSMSGHSYIFNLNNERFTDVLPLTQKVEKWHFIYKNPFFTPTVMALRKGFKLFDDSFRRVDDYKCWLENFKEGEVYLLTSELAGGFKHPIGAGGLTSSVDKMHKAYVLVLRALYNENVISKMFFYFALTIEFFKYPMRLLLKYIKGFYSFR